MNESDLLAFEQVQVQSALSELQPQIKACQASGDHNVLGELIAKRDALLGHLAAVEDYSAGVLCDI